MEETIIKDICTHDKRLWVFFKYIISPKMLQYFESIKLQRRFKNINDFNYNFKNKNIMFLKPEYIDSIKIIPAYSPLGSHYKYNDFAKDLI